MTARDIRERYPHPHTASQASATDYCVGGALCKYLAAKAGWHGDNFPMVSALSDVLQEANDHLTYAGALRRAKGITVANDCGQFDRAWHLLDLALQAKR